MAPGLARKNSTSAAYDGSAPRGGRLFARRAIGAGQFVAAKETTRNNRSPGESRDPLCSRSVVDRWVPAFAGTAAHVCAEGRRAGFEGGRAFGLAFALPLVVGLRAGAFAPLPAAVAGAALRAARRGLPLPLARCTASSSTARSNANESGSAPRGSE